MVQGIRDALWWVCFKIVPTLLVLTSKQKFIQRISRSVDEMIV